MSFFEDIDQIRILERNAEKLMALEERQARKLIATYKRGRELIRQRLSTVVVGTFSEAQLRQALLQTESIIRELDAKLSKQIRFGFEIAEESGIEDMAREVNAFEKEFNGITSAVPVELIVATTERKNFLLNQFQASINAYTRQTRDNIQRALSESLIAKDPFNRVVDRVAANMIVDEWKVLRIVRTELHQVYNISKMSSLSNIKDQILPDLKKTMFHPMDSRTGDDSKAMDSRELIVDIDKPFRFTFKGKKFVFFAPPNRPNDRAILIPYRKSYDN